MKGEPLIKNPGIRIGTIVLILLVLAITFFIFMKNISSAGETKEKDFDTTVKLDPSLQPLIRRPDTLLRHLSLKAGKPEYKSFLILDEDANFYDKNARYAYCYSTIKNELLHTNRFLPGKNLDGIVLTKLESKEVGHYGDGKDVFDKASRLYIAIRYVKLPEAIIEKTDTVWGAMPAGSKKTGDSGLGDMPKDEEIVRQIGRTIGYGQ